MALPRLLRLLPSKFPQRSVLLGFYLSQTRSTPLWHKLGVFTERAFLPPFTYSCLEFLYVKESSFHVAIIDEAKMKNTWEKKKFKLGLCEGGNDWEQTSFSKLKRGQVIYLHLERKKRGDGSKGGWHKTKLRLPKGSQAPDSNIPPWFTLPSHPQSVLHFVVKSGGKRLL